MRVKFMKLSIIMFLSLALLVLCFSDTRGLARPSSTPEEGGWWLFYWRSYQGVSISQGTIEYWHDRGSYMLYNVDDDDDVPAYVILDCVSYSPNWFCTGGTDEVESWDEIETMAEEMDNFDSLVVTSIEVDNVSYNGYCWEDKIFIISSPGDNTLAHETGHLADLDDIYTSGEKDRIMFWKDYGGNELRSYEAEAYEGAAQPPEKK